MYLRMLVGMGALSHYVYFSAICRAIVSLVREALPATHLAITFLEVDPHG